MLNGASVQTIQSNAAKLISTKIFLNFQQITYFATSLLFLKNFWEFLSFIPDPYHRGVSDIDANRGLTHTWLFPPKNRDQNLILAEGLVLMGNPMQIKQQNSMYSPKILYQIDFGACTQAGKGRESMWTPPPF